MLTVWKQGKKTNLGHIAVIVGTDLFLMLFLSQMISSLWALYTSTGVLKDEG